MGKKSLMSNEEWIREFPSLTRKFKLFSSTLGIQKKSMENIKLCEKLF